ncbi:MAG: hypothetical protein C4519_07860 [Desulfobacteraceae bacterium]|nr:MAG: hypothetical protein C4519_07860 [Desulfobacteraceae bacterium]
MTKILRDEKEVKLNDLLRASRRAAEHYGRAVEVLGQDAAAPVFRNLAEDRAGLCQAIERFIRACGYLPDTPDPDRRTVIDLTERTKAFFARDAQKTVLNRADRLETDILSCFKSVFRQAWKEDRHSELRRLEKDFQSGKQALEKLQALYS